MQQKQSFNGVAEQNDTLQCLFLNVANLHMRWKDFHHIKFSRFSTINVLI